jgi:hypothetical protein
MYADIDQGRSPLSVSEEDARATVERTRKLFDKMGLPKP